MRALTMLKRKTGYSLRPSCLIFWITSAGRVDQAGWSFKGRPSWYAGQAVYLGSLKLES